MREVVAGPIVISIGLILASSAIANCQTNWLVAVIGVAVIVICNIWGRGMVKIVPILLGVVVSYAVAAALGEVDFSGVAAAPWVGLPIVWDNTVFALFGPQFDSGLATTVIITIMPLAFATMIEHIGDISAILSVRLASATTLPIPVCIARCSATALPRFWLRSLALRPTPRMARTPACSP